MGFSKDQAINKAGNALSGLIDTLRSQMNRNGSSSRQRTPSTPTNIRLNTYNIGSSRPTERSSSQEQRTPSTPTNVRLNTYGSNSSQATGYVPTTLGNRARLTESGEEYDSAQEEAAQQQEEEQQQLEESSAGDNFLADFDAYSAEHLNGQGINDFMRVDPNSQEDRDAWRAMVEDETMSAYYNDIIAEYGGFDQYWDAMTANTLADVLADDQLQLQYFGAGDVSQSIMDQLAYEGYYPTITGDTGQQAEIAALLEADPQAAADLMTYNYRQNLGGMLAQEVDSGNMTLDEARDILSLDEYNELGDYGNMQYGYDNGYNMGASEFDPGSFEVNGVISPAEWNKSIENRYTSLPGYGLASVGDDRAIARYLYNAGYQEQEGVPELWANYYGEDNGEEE